MEAPERMLTAGEVAVLFRVNEKTVRRWMKDGKLPHVRTPGGRYRVRESVILAQTDRLIRALREVQED